MPNEVASECPNCGMSIPADASLCPHCGSQLRKGKDQSPFLRHLLPGLLRYLVAGLLGLAVLYFGFLALFATVWIFYVGSCEFYGCHQSRSPEDSVWLAKTAALTSALLVMAVLAVFASRRVRESNG